MDLDALLSLHVLSAFIASQADMDSRILSLRA